MMSTTRLGLAALLVVTATATAHARDLTAQQCVEAHSRGQDARSDGKISLARELFMSCAQKSCPALVQEDCAQFANDLNREQPTLAFVARDASGADLPDTTVYVDDALVATRLDDGTPHDVDPGKHVVKFTHGGREQFVTVVANSGEKGRIVTASFPAASSGEAPVLPAVTRAAPAIVNRRSHPGGAKVALVVGSLAFVGGAALGVYELGQVPAVCTLASHQCSAPPGDPVFGEAAHAVRLSNVGFAVGAVGLAAAVGGAVWYVKGARTERASGVAIAPWFARGGGGLAFSGRL